MTHLQEEVIAKIQHLAPEDHEYVVLSKRARKNVGFLFIASCA
jgi:hypothetical protein